MKRNPDPDIRWNTARLYDNLAKIEVVREKLVEDPKAVDTMDLIVLREQLMNNRICIEALYDAVFPQKPEKKVRFKRFRRKK